MVSGQTIFKPRKEEYRGTNDSFRQLSDAAAPLSPPVALSESAFLAVSSSLAAGIGNVGGVTRLFTVTLPNTFAQSNGSSSDGAYATLLYRAGTFFFALEGASSDRLCTATMTSSFTCVDLNARTASGSFGPFALGTSDNLYISIERPSGKSLQVRSASTLALQWEIPLPSSCADLIPTCIQGRPVIGCLDSSAFYFLETDARGIDTSAEWPMYGHDPGRTFNQSTPLSAFACP